MVGLALPAWQVERTGYRPISARERVSSGFMSAVLIAALLFALLRVAPPMVLVRSAPLIPAIFRPLPLDPPIESPRAPEPRRPDPGGRPAPRAEQPIPQPAVPPVRLNSASSPSVFDTTPAPLAPPSAAPADPNGDGSSGTAVATNAGPVGGDGRGDDAGVGDGDGVGSINTAVPAKWAREPGWEEIYAFHPEAAKVARQAGKAMLGCQVTLKRRLVNCMLREESPVGWGFGKAALRLVPTLRAFPRRINGREIDLAWVKFTIRFDPPLLPAEQPRSRPN